MAQVPYTEKAFLQLVGRRVLNYTREAAARGEKYHDLSGYAKLQCGVSAKFTFEEAPGGYIPVVHLKEEPSFSPSQLKEIAAEILNAPSKLRTAKGDDLEYVRESDASASTPG